jgi:hypothetical protein
MDLPAASRPRVDRPRWARPARRTRPPSTLPVGTPSVRLHVRQRHSDAAGPSWTAMPFGTTGGQGVVPRPSRIFSGAIGVRVGQEARQVPGNARSRRIGGRFRGKGEGADSRNQEELCQSTRCFALLVGTTRFLRYPLRKFSAESRFESSEHCVEPLDPRASIGGPSRLGCATLFGLALCCCANLPGLDQSG